MSHLHRLVRFLELLVCGPTAHQHKMAAVEVSLPTMDEIDYELLGSTKKSVRAK